ncbi:hypothetical protein P6Q80_002272 [Klebsiella pneumoniae]|nr:hypothetical protein [Klebsiella pneumoniae]EKZ6414580.1 hypothetical protein [Klebsiella pneumoniae]
MTDITELAQREKFEAWAEEVGALPWGILKKHRNQDGSYPGPHYTYMWKAWQAASAELVEALEKAQETIAFQQGEIKALLSSLESRTVTVKLPQAASAGGQGYQEQVERILTDAGIKVEAE